jgi:hypothetical protein
MVTGWPMNLNGEGTSRRSAVCCPGRSLRGTSTSGPLVSQPSWMLHRLRGLRVRASQLGSLSGTSPAPDADCPVQDGSGGVEFPKFTNAATEVLPCARVPLHRNAAASAVPQGYIRNSLSLELLGYPHRASRRVPQRVRISTSRIRPTQRAVLDVGDGFFLSFFFSG